MRRPGRGWVLAPAAVAVVAVLTVPFGFGHPYPFCKAAGFSAHVLLFASLAWIVERTWTGQAAKWMFFILVVLAPAMELVQPLVGRSGEWQDALWGVLGVAWVAATGRLRLWGWVRLFGAGCLAALPPAWEGGMWRQEIRAFPALVRPGARWSEQRWELNDLRLSAAGHAGYLRCERRTGRRPEDKLTYPGLFRTPASSDWREMVALCASVYWPGPDSAIFALRVDDRHGNPPYPDRFQREFSATQGWNEVRVSAEEMRRTSGGRPMDLGEIRRWGVFLVEGGPFDYFLLGPVYLER
jgi:hypothetical protein